MDDQKKTTDKNNSNKKLEPKSEKEKNIKIKATNKNDSNKNDSNKKPKIENDTKPTTSIEANNQNNSNKKPEPKRELNDLLKIKVIKDEILNHLSLDDKDNLAQTSKSAYSAIKDTKYGYYFKDNAEMIGFLKKK